MSAVVNAALAIALTVAKDDVLLPVALKPRGRANVILGIRAGAVLVSVTAAPVEGAANAALLEVLAVALQLPKSRIEVARGQKSRTKVIRLKNVAPAAIQACLDALG